MLSAFAWLTGKIVAKVNNNALLDVVIDQKDKRDMTNSLATYY